jgi:type IV pilus assembly protein PilM
LGGLTWKQRLLRPLHLIQRWKQSAAEQLVGLDIGPGFVKLLKMDPEDDPGWVEAFGVVPLPSGAIAKDEIKDAAAVGAALRQVFDETQVKSKNVALAIPRSSTIIKTIAVNKKLGAADIESRAWVEANHHFPDLVGDIYLDFDIVGPSAQDPSQLDLLLVACRKDQIKPYLDILQENGLTAKVVDVNCYAFERALSLITKREPELKTVALLNLDYNISSLVVVHEKQMIYAHDHSYEGLYFSAQVEQYLAAHKEDKAVQKNLANTQEYQDILKAGTSAHLRHSMHFFYSSRPHITIQKLVLAGACASLPYLSSFIQKETGIETVLADPFVGMTLASAIDEKLLQQTAPSLMLCCGLALSRQKEREV